MPPLMLLLKCAATEQTFLLAFIKLPTTLNKIKASEHFWIIAH